MQGTVETPHTSGLFANPVFPCLNRNNEVEAPLDAGLANAEESLGSTGFGYISNTLHQSI